MSFTNSNDYITGRKPIPTPSGGEILAVRFTVDLPTGDLQANDIGQIGILPAGCLPVDVHVDGTDMDSSTAALIFQVGLLNAAEDDLSTASADGGAYWCATTAANAAFHQRPTINGLALVSVTKSVTDRKLGLKVGTAPTTAVAGTVGVTLFYKAA